MQSLVPKTNVLSIRPQGRATSCCSHCSSHNPGAPRMQWGPVLHCSCAFLRFCRWPVGLMDKASAPGAGDSRFESWAGQLVLHCFLLCLRWSVDAHKLCRDPGSNRGPSDLRSDALPTELSRLSRWGDRLVIPSAPCRHIVIIQHMSQATRMSMPPTAETHHHVPA